jgi:anti-sigma B factor antagonist
MNPFQVETERRNGQVVIRPTGHIDLATAGGFAVAIHAALSGGARSIIVDLAGIRFVDSSGICAFVRARKRAAAQGTDLKIRGAQRAVHRVLKTSGVIEFLGDDTAPTA